jgi:predicted lysophospholipase L1 biosynthesis ABC-type transport system permease subunit
VVLGVAGVALAVRRGLEERRGELALLNAVGVSRRRVVALLAAEYGTLVAAGLLAGVVPAWVAVQPAARSLHGALPWGAMAGVVAGLCGGAAASVFSAAWAAARRYGPEVLKEEV